MRMMLMKEKLTMVLSNWLLVGLGVHVRLTCFVVSVGVFHCWRVLWLWHHSEGSDERVAFHADWVKVSYTGNKLSWLWRMMSSFLLHLGFFTEDNDTFLSFEATLDTKSWCNLQLHSLSTLLLEHVQLRIFLGIIFYIVLLVLCGTKFM